MLNNTYYNQYISIPMNVDASVQNSFTTTNTNFTMLYAQINNLINAVNTLEQHIKNEEDLEYFQKKIFQSLKIPENYFLPKEQAKLEEFDCEFPCNEDKDSKMEASTNSIEFNKKESIASIKERIKRGMPERSCDKFNNGIMAKVINNEIIDATYNSYYDRAMSLLK